MGRCRFVCTRRLQGGGCLEGVARATRVQPSVGDAVVTDRSYPEMKGRGRGARKREEREMPCNEQEREKGGFASSHRSAWNEWRCLRVSDHASTSRDKRTQKADARDLRASIDIMHNRFVTDLFNLAVDTGSAQVPSTCLIGALKERAYNRSVPIKVWMVRLTGDTASSGGEAGHYLPSKRSNQSVECTVGRSALSVV